MLQSMGLQRVGHDWATEQQQSWGGKDEFSGRTQPRDTGSLKTWNVIIDCRTSQVAQVVKQPLASAGDMGSISESGRSPGGGNGNPFQYSCPENPMDRRSQTWLSTHKHTVKQLQLKELQASDPAEEGISWGSKNKDARGILASNTMVAAPVNTT